MTRDPPDYVKRALRGEVGFGCPIPDCGNPYLEWHHFDPPWRIENHHRVEGMIALCREHHIQADHGAFTIEQLRAFKRDAMNNWKQIQGRFNWMRNRLLAVVGGNYYYEIPVILQFRGQPIISFERNSENYLLLNLFMLTTSGQNRAYIRQNNWFNTGGEEDIEAPPSGRRVSIRYPNGDYVCVEFFELSSLDDARKRYPHSKVDRWDIALPVTVVEITNTVAGTGIDFSPTKSQVGGITMIDCFMSNCPVGISLG